MWVRTEFRGCCHVEERPGTVEERRGWEEKGMSRSQVVKDPEQSMGRQKDG